MQTIKIDLAKRMICPVILAQQEDIGRKVKIEILDNGQPYAIPAGTNFSVWYSGDSGSGNYTHIGTKSAFEVSGNTVTVELITQMLTNAGKGDMTIVMHGADGTQIGSLQLPYWTEGMPGAGSEGAQQYYTAFQQMVKEAVDAAATFKTDTTLSEEGKAADAAATGEALAGKAPAGYGLGEIVPANLIQTQSALDACITGGQYRLYGYENGSFWGVVGHSSGLLEVKGSRTVENGIRQYFYPDDATGHLVRKLVDGVWQPWEWTNPPMEAGVEYRTTERWNGAAVKTKLVSLGSFTGSTVVPLGDGYRHCVRIEGCASYDNGYRMKMQDGEITTYTNGGLSYVKVDIGSKTTTGAWVQMWYV